MVFVAVNRCFCLFYFIGFLRLINSTFREPHQCMPDHDCLPLTKCIPKSSETIIYPCHNGLNLVCCPSTLQHLEDNSTLTLLNRKTSLFPVDCGVVLVQNKISGGKTADFGQFPWMALLGYKIRGFNDIEFLCGGTLITERYILTAAHCLGTDHRIELSIVRLGEHNLRTQPDCYNLTMNNKKFCASPHLDIPIESFKKHEEFNPTSLKNDIGLVKLSETVTFTDYIQPICLPFERNIEKKDLTGQKFTISGWGKTNAKQLSGSDTLQFAKVTVWAQKKCNKLVPPEVKNISESQLCANGKREDVCKGDSGGPMVNSSRGLDGEIRNFQIGIVSFASSLTCGVEELPPIYTRVDKFLSWLVNNVN